MDFEISEELKLIRETTMDFVKRGLLPLERDLLESENGSLPKEAMQELKKKAKEIGLSELRIPKEFGGLGTSILELCLVEEELSKTIIPFNFGDVTPILFHCNEEQRKRYLDPTVEGTKQYSIALLEPGAFHLNSLKTMALKENGYYVIEGQKLVMKCFDIGDFVITFAVTDPEKSLREGVTCFLVDRNTDGLINNSVRKEMRWKDPLIEPIILKFNRCKVPVNSILGEVGHAFSLGVRWLPGRRIVRAARCVGVGKRLLEICSEYAKTWETFGGTISGQTRVQRILADLATDIQATRLMVYHAAFMADKGEDIRREAAMVKVFATEMLHRAVDKTVQIHGGPVYNKGLFIERLSRNTVEAKFIEETIELQRSIIARDILRGISF